MASKLPIDIDNPADAEEAAATAAALWGALDPDAQLGEVDTASQLLVIDADAKPAKLPASALPISDAITSLMGVNGSGQLEKVEFEAQETAPEELADFAVLSKVGSAPKAIAGDMLGSLIVTKLIDDAAQVGNGMPYQLGLNADGLVAKASLHPIYASHYGAKGDGSADDRSALQLCIDLSEATGRPIVLDGKLYLIGSSGNSISGRAYGLLLKSGTSILAYGSGNCAIKAAAGSEIDVITTPRATPCTDITLAGFTIDGNETQQTTAGGFNAYLFDVTGLVINDVKSKNPGSFGLRIQQCDRAFLDQIRADHSAETNSDGVHFIDTNNVVIGTVQVYTEGDDAFIIEAINRDVKNYSIGQLIVSAPSSAISAAKRGLAIFCDTDLVSAARVFSNIHVASLVVDNCVGPAIALAGGSFENVRINAVTKNCRSFLYAYPGNGSVYNGYLRNCSFVGIGENLAQRAIDTGNAGGNVIVGNHIDVLIRNPGDGYEGAVLVGDEWSGSLRVDYDPDGTKASPSVGIVIHGADNDLNVSAKGANVDLQMRSTATNNNIKIGYLKEADTNALQIDSGATLNRFSGGRIAGAIVNNGGSSNTFNNVGGATVRSRVSMDFSIAADGTYTWTHGLNGTPNLVLATLNTVANTFHLQVQSVSSTNVVFKLWNTSGAAITSGTYQAYVDCRL